MHHRRGRTTRREVKRLDDKSYRQAERRALREGSADTPPQDSWGYRPEPLPLGDVPCNGKVHGKHKKGKQKDRCPVNRVHEWYKEEIVVEEWFRYWYSNLPPRLMTRKYKVKTCIHCWKEVRKYVPEPYRYSWRGKKVLPKRPVKF